MTPVVRVALILKTKQCVWYLKRSCSANDQTQPMSSRNLIQFGPLSCENYFEATKLPRENEPKILWNRQ